MDQKDCDGRAKIYRGNSGNRMKGAEFLVEEPALQETQETMARLVIKL